MLQKNMALYIHIPFCARHCSYCDFNVHVEKEQSPVIQQTVDAICSDIENSEKEMKKSGELSRTLDTIFFGGGTPTFLSGCQLRQILEAARNSFALTEDAEISSEANPGSSDAEKFAEMRSAGFNRLSIGVQSFDDALLARLDRTHSAGEAEGAVRASREAGFDNVSLDLMFGLPTQNLSLWKESMERALACRTEHLSLYALTLEPGTRFERLNKGGKISLPDEDVELSMYEEAISMLREAGYMHYEVSNFSKPGFQCRHNMTYWRNGEYLGVGPGAVSYLNGRRWKRERMPSRYVEKVKTGADLSVESEHLEASGTLGETMILGLRLLEGISLSSVQKRFDLDPLDYFAKQIERLTKLELLVVKGDSLRLTHRGLLLANNVLCEFLPD